MSAAPSTATFHHGVHPLEHKDQTEHEPLQRMPFVERYFLPLGQHGGAPSKALGKPGDRVSRGQIIGEPASFVSTSLHSPVSGRVMDLSPHRHPNGSLVPTYEILADPFSTQQISRSPAIDWSALELAAFVDHVQRAGLVGMGGAAFPSHVKYQLPEGKHCEHLVINGCECEPYLTGDHRLMVERAEDVVQGARILGTMLGAESTTIGVEINKPDAIQALQEHVPPNANMTITPLKVKYPQGAEKMLIKAIYDIEVPAGKLPIDVSIVVNNVATMAAMADYFHRGIPLIERVVTVAGPGIERPSNLIVPVGTPVRDVLSFCGLRPETRQVIMGGPMMGQPLASLDVPVLKGTSGLLAFTESVIQHPTEYACVRCGQCLEACGNQLNPSLLAQLARARRWDELEKAFVLDCMECGGCTYTCPSGIPIVHLIRAAKAVVRERKARGSS